MTDLERLSLADNQLFGVIPDSIGQLINLTDVDLSGNRNLSGTFPNVFGLSKLVTLRLDHTGVGGAIPDRHRVQPESVASFEQRLWW